MALGAFDSVWGTEKKKAKNISGATSNTGVNLDYGSGKGTGGSVDSPVAKSPAKIAPPEEQVVPPVGRDKMPTNMPLPDYVEEEYSGIPSVASATPPIEEEYSGIPSVASATPPIEEEYSGVPSIVDGQVADSTPPGDPSVDPLDQLYQDLLSQHEESWQNQEDIARAQGAAGQRRAANMAAGMGAAVGGGTFAAGQAQAGLKGQEMMMDARAEHDVRGLELKMTNLQNQLKIAEGQKDRDAQEKIQAMINNTAMLIEWIRGGGDPDIPPEEMTDTNTSAGESLPVPSISDDPLDDQDSWWDKIGSGTDWAGDKLKGLKDRLRF